MPRLVQGCWRPNRRQSWPLQHAQVDGERDELSKGERPPGDHGATLPQHCDRSDAQQRDDQRMEPARDQHEPSAARQVLVVGLGKALTLMPLLDVGPDDAAPGEILLHDGAELGQLLLHSLRAVMDHASKVANHPGDDDERREGHGKEPDLESGHETHGRHQCGCGVGRVHDAWAKHHADGRQIVGGTAHQLADPMCVVVPG
jgi:hypothetical protein